MASPSPSAGGALIALGVVVGTVTGFLIGETTAGFLVGLGLGVGASLIIWRHGAR